MRGQVKEELLFACAIAAMSALQCGDGKTRAEREEQQAAAVFAAVAEDCYKRQCTQLPQAKIFADPSERCMRQVLPGHTFDVERTVSLVSPLVGVYRFTEVRQCATADSSYTGTWVTEHAHHFACQEGVWVPTTRTRTSKYTSRRIYTSGRSETRTNDAVLRDCDEICAESKQEIVDAQARRR